MHPCPSAANLFTNGMPPRWQISYLKNCRVQPNDLFKADDTAVFLIAIRRTDKLPPVIIQIM